MDKLEKLVDICMENNRIYPELYDKYDVKRGLRDLDGKGVLAGLTKISDITSTKNIDGIEIPASGVLKYRGINIELLTKGFIEGKRFGFEETTYLLLFGKLPNEEELEEFKKIIAVNRDRKSVV